ncbi:MAG: hypothetical protein EXR72_21195 [Myxococcales bacterium]|nr:hypothetical protein [Myxococcales bacterium]
MPSLRTGRLRLRLRDEQEPARGPPPLLSTRGLPVGGKTRGGRPAYGRRGVRLRLLVGVDGGVLHIGRDEADQLGRESHHLARVVAVATKLLVDRPGEDLDRPFPLAWGVTFGLLPLHQLRH